MIKRYSLKIIARKAGALLLSVIMAATMMPALAYADSEADAADQAAVQTEEAKSSDQAESQTISDASAALDEPQTDDAAEETLLIEYTPDVDLPDDNTLLEQYLEQQADGTLSDERSDIDNEAEESIRSMPKLASRGTQLTGTELAMYNELAAGIRKIASGQTNESRVRITTYKSGCDFALIIHSLMTDMPYEMYWYDKTADPNPVVLYRNTAGEVNVYFAVAEAYRGAYRGSVGSSNFPWYDLNGKTSIVNAAVSNAGEIVSYYADEEDLVKLEGYKDEICSLTSFNHQAADSSNKIPYGDPWQLIYVFDGDPDTNVVCEGYSKAFQYLCDLTSFDNDTIECYTIYGNLVNETNFQEHIGNYSSYQAYATDKNNADLQGHMWNVLHMDDGRNYLADITNCDTGHTGFPDKLFMAYYTGGALNEWGYVYLNQLRYLYDTTTVNLYYTYELTMSDTSYDCLADKIWHYPANPATCTQSGTAEYWMKNNLYYADNYCLHEITSAQTVTKPLGHNFVAADRSLDEITYRCTRCGESHTDSQVVVDRPKVSIRSLVKAKKGFTVKWKKLSASKRRKISGFEIQYSMDRTFSDAMSYDGLTRKSAFGTVKVARKTSVSKKIAKLKKKKTYYVRIRTYKWIGGVKHVSEWSAARKVKSK